MHFGKSIFLALAATLLGACGGDPGASVESASEGSGGASRFVSRVVSFTPGPNAGFGQSKMPGIVEGPPRGAGDHQGSLDCLSLGDGGEIVVELGDFAIDGPGADFIVFENPFFTAKGATFAEPGEVSVSDDGTTWHTYPCTATAAPFGACAGWHPVYSSPDDGISPFDAAKAGGDPFDLADLGLARAKFVRIRDMMSKLGATPFAGFDLDAIAVIHAATP